LSIQVSLKDVYLSLGSVESAALGWSLGAGPKVWSAIELRVMERRHISYAFDVFDNVLDQWITELTHINSI
jgi:hypothetical protein